MKYTSYIAERFKANGVPNLSNKGFGILMNIIHVEGAMAGLKKMQDKEPTEEAKLRYGIWLEDYKMKLESLTWKLEPKKLIEQILMVEDFK